MYGTLISLVFMFGSRVVTLVWLLQKFLEHVEIRELVNFYDALQNQITGLLIPQWHFL